MKGKAFLQYNYALYNTIFTVAILYLAEEKVLLHTYFTGNYILNNCEKNS